MELLKQLYGIHSSSGKEKKIRTFIEKHIARHISGASVRTDKAGNLFVTKGQADSYPCLAAHMDQVQEHRSGDFTIVETDDILFGYSPSKRRHEGLGADDKNGIWVALKCLEEFEVLKVAFFVAEEVGCRGSYAADIAFFSDCRFVVEADRRGYKDLIVEIGCMRICNETFIEAVQPARFGYAPADGMMTDVEALHNNGIGLSCVNVSCGYYDPHTDHEFTVKKDLQNCLAFVSYIVEHCTEVYPHEIVQERWSGYGAYDDDLFDDCGCGYCGYGQENEDMACEIIASHPDYTAEEAWEVYHTNFPDLMREEFLYLYENCWLTYYGMESPRKAKPEKSRRKKKKAAQKQIRKTSSGGDTLNYHYFMRPAETVKKTI